MTSRALPSVTGAIAIALTLAGLAAGCGDSNSATTDPAAAFAGTWSYDPAQESSVLQCPGADATNQLPDPNKTLARGISSALVDLSPSPLLPGVFCNFVFDIDASGAIATAHAGQTCALTSLDNLSLDTAMDGTSLWTFTLTSATTAEELVQATAHFQIAGQIQSCSWNLKAHLTRVSKE
jgi:hypothetical protein